MDNSTILPVYLRLKPKPTNYDGSTEPFLKCIPESTCQVQCEPPKSNRYKNEETFSFSGVYRGTSTQLEVYKQVMLPLVTNVLSSASDSMFFTMGPSGAGKSHTTLGYKQTPGMIHLAVDTIFKSIGSENIAQFEDIEDASDMNPNRLSSAIEAGLFLDWSKTGARQKFSANSMYKETVDVNERAKYAVFVSMVEIYNERIFNLLDSNSKKQVLGIKKNAEGKVYLANTQKVYVSEREEAYRVIDQGLAKRQANATGLNQTSSRSHAFTIIEIKKFNSRRKELTSATLSVVDLAGSERNKMSKTVGKELTESCSINRSLMELGQCLEKQRQKKVADTSSIFRNSKLTQLLLSNVFVPKLNQKTVIMVNVDPYGDYNGASQMLRYSALAREIKVPEYVQQSSNRDRNSSVSQDSSTTLNDEYESDKENRKSEGGRIAELERMLEEANDRCAEIEQQTRDEVMTEMEGMMETMQRDYLMQMDTDYERSQDLVDNKVEMTNTIRNDEFEGLLLEIEQLRKENRQLRQQLVQKK